MDDQVNERDIQQADPEAQELSDRRDFLRSLGKWSTAAIGAILVSESTQSSRASAWATPRDRPSMVRARISEGGRWLA